MTSPADSLGPSTARQHGAVAEGELDEVVAVGVRSRVEPACSARVSAVGGQGVQARRARAAASSNQSWGRQTAAVRAAFAGSCSATQRALVAVNDATGTDPTASAHARGPPRLGDQPGGLRGRPVVVPEQGRADDLAAVVERDVAVLLGPDRDGVDVVQAAGVRRGLRRARSQACGSTSVPGGCGACPRRTSDPSSASRTTTVHDWVEQSMPATSVTGARQPRPGGGRGRMRPCGTRWQGGPRASSRPGSSRSGGTGAALQGPAGRRPPGLAHHGRRRGRPTRRARAGRRGRAGGLAGRRRSTLVDLSPDIRFAGIAIGATGLSVGVTDGRLTTLGDPRTAQCDITAGPGGRARAGPRAGARGDGRGRGRPG